VPKKKEIRDVRRKYEYIKANQEIGYENSARPMFELLGTAEEHKKIKAYPTDHIPPKPEYVREILDWLDKYFGPVTGSRK
jgi:hypothetical protein